jgi:hypothetical protein
LLLGATLVLSVLQGAVLIDACRGLRV